MNQGFKDNLHIFFLNLVPSALRVSYVQTTKHLQF